MKLLKPLFLSLILTSVITHTVTAQQTTDPYHKSSGGYGYLLESNSNFLLWWSEGAYKVMQDTPQPDKKSSCITINSAKNEWESIILVISPKVDMQSVEITVSDFVANNSNSTNSIESLVRKVEYVEVTTPTDSYGFKGMWPDPLPLYKGGETLSSGINNPFWINFKTPAKTEKGEYSATITVSSNLGKTEIPVKLNVWGFELPKSPSMRSGFGLNVDNINTYNNIESDEQRLKVFDNHMRLFADYKVAPYNPFEYAPIREDISGVEWIGGFFDSTVKRSGNYSYMLVDKSLTENVEGESRNNILVDEESAYEFSFWAMSEVEAQSFVVGIECYNNDGELMWWNSSFEEFRADNEWNSYKLALGETPKGCKSIKVRLFPSKRTATGENQGVVWFDDMAIVKSQNVAKAAAWVQEQENVALANSDKSDVNNNDNILKQGNFEVDINAIDISLDFTDFNIAAKRYLTDFGFNSFNLRLKGLGGGTYYSRTGGVFEGFAQGTEEYEKLMERYLKQIEDNLSKMDIIDKAYVYWFDEPGEADYPFVHETNEMIKRYAPALTTFLTEHIAGQDISDVTDISCTIWHKLNHDKIQKMNSKGLEHWSYLCCWPKSPWISEFIDHDAINMRMWMWASYIHGLNGILIWETSYWNSPEASPVGELQNPWTQAMSWVTGYGWIQGKQTIWGNGDGRMIYPENRDVNADKSVYDNEAIPSLRLESIRDGIDDFEYLKILEQLVANSPNPKSAKVKRAKELLKIPTTIYKSEDSYNKDPQSILKYRVRIAEAIESLL